MNLTDFKTWTIIALFSDDYLADIFALKGGSALESIYNLHNRASIDIDVSMENDFPESEFPKVEEKLKKAIESVFDEHGYTIFDFKFYRTPGHQDEERARYWGGYSVEFKIYKTEEFNKLSTLEQAQRSAEPIGKRRTFTIDISKYEFCAGKAETELEGYTIYVYTLDMILYEKLRALCQQLPNYFINEGRFKKARPRDFYDIYTIMTKKGMSFSDLNISILKEFFSVKKVELSLLKDIPIYYDKYIEGLRALTDTLLPDEQKNFDFNICYNFVIDGINELLKEQ